MAKGIRVNLCVPPHVDAILSDLARTSGRSKASWVMEAIEFQLPSWFERRRVLTTEGEHLAVNKLLPSNGGQVFASRGESQQRLMKRFSEAVEHRREQEKLLTRQQRRQIEREQRKQAQRGNKLSRESDQPAESCGQVS